MVEQGATIRHAWIDQNINQNLTTVTKGVEQSTVFDYISTVTFLSNQQNCAPDGSAHIITLCWACIPIELFNPPTLSLFKK